jgi:hypothetical protein
VRSIERGYRGIDSIFEIPYGEYKQENGNRQLVHPDSPSLVQKSECCDGKPENQRKFKEELQRSVLFPLLSGGDGGDGHEGNAASAGRSRRERGARLEQRRSDGPTRRCD